MELYMQDNRRAWHEGVRVPSHDSLLCRLAQWNVYGFSHETPSTEKSSRTGIMETLFVSDADIIILNEYHFSGKTSFHHAFEKQLRERGYETHCATVFAPTFVATRLFVDHVQEILLDNERSAMVLRVEIAPCETVWIVGTHLNDYDGVMRNEEMKELLEELPASANERVIIAGDFNQQRQQDYQDDEWESICANQAKRNAPRDDGVVSQQHKAGYSCLFDQTPPKCNWRFSMKPPSTHWTGTIVDYAYGRNVSAQGVYISPAYWSDHRMVVSDWSW